MRRFIWTLACVVLLVLSLAAMIVVPFAQEFLASRATSQLGGAGGGQASAAATPTKPSQTTAPVPSVTPTPVHLDPIVYGGKRLDGKLCLGFQQTPVEMVKEDFGWSRDWLSPRYQTNGDGIKVPVISLCNDYWPWRTPTHLAVSEVLKTLHWPDDLVPQARRQQTIEVAPLVYGGKGNNGKTCLGTSGSPAEMLKKDFDLDVSNPPAGGALLTSRYLDPRILLCNDSWPWIATGSIGDEPSRPLGQVIKDIHWPDDLIEPDYSSYPVRIRLLGDFDPQTAHAVLQQIVDQTEQQKKSAGPCDWVPDLGVFHPHINICEPIKGLIHAIADGIRGDFIRYQKQLAFLWQTPTEPFTQEESGLPSFWQFSWGLVLAFLAAVIAWVGLRILIGSAVSWLSYASALEMIPRLVFALIAAYFSKDLFLGLVRANNAFAEVFAASTIKTLLSQQSGGTLEAILQIIYAVMAFLFVIEEAARMAVLYLLFAFAPILLLCAALRETEAVARVSVISAILFVFLQTMQLAVLDVGGHLISSVLGGTAGSLVVLQLLAALAILYIALMLFFSVGRIALGGTGMPFASGVLWASTGMFGGMALSLARAAWRSWSERTHHTSSRNTDTREEAKTHTTGSHTGTWSRLRQLFPGIRQRSGTRGPSGPGQGKPAPTNGPFSSRTSPGSKHASPQRQPSGQPPATGNASRRAPVPPVSSGGRVPGGTTTSSGGQALPRPSAPASNGGTMIRPNPASGRRRVSPPSRGPRPLRRPPSGRK